MPRNVDGTYDMPVNSANPAVPLTAIDSTAFNSIMDDIEAALAYGDINANSITAENTQRRKHQRRKHPPERRARPR